MTNLLIIESPGKQKTIQGYLGSDWTVVASYGHIRGIKESIEFIQNDFETTYEYNKEKTKAITQIKDAAKKATNIYLGSDKDLEGEQIAYSLCVLLRLNPSTAKRIIFTEITKKAILHAIEHAGHIDMNRVHAQQARAMLDMMIGFTISPILWRYVAANLSAGRCQTPALRLVIEREEAIENFKGSSSWQLQGTFESRHDNYRFPSIMTDELDDEESAVNYMENVHQTKRATVVSTQLRPWSESAPAPLITSTLQQQASAKFGLNPKSTMQIAQRLYEAGHITYMRTDQAIMSEEAKTAAKAWVASQYGEEYVQTAEVKKKKKAEEPASQEAHEAIRPTHMEITEIEGDAYERKVYQLIWQRAVQSIMSPVRGETYSITLQIDQDEFSWLSTWKRTTFEGWRKAGAVASLDQESDEEAVPKDNNWDQAIQIKEGAEVEWIQMKAIPKETKAHGRYTEATLVRELESHGIGRPSTFASLLSAIQDRNYVETRDFPSKEIPVKEYQLQPSIWPPLARTIKRKVGAEKHKLVPTELGRSVWNYLSQTFADLFAYPFTAQMEQRLDHIAKGEEPWKRVLQETWTSYKDRYEDLLQKKAALSTNPKVKEFSGGVKAVQSKKGPLLLIEGKTKDDTQFLGWPKGVAFDKITEEMIATFRSSQTAEKEANRLGEWEGEPIQKHDGKFGTYLRCGELTIPFQEETLEETIERFRIKKEGGTNVIQTFKEYVIRTGPYGPYVMKTSLKKPQFVSLPKGIDPTNLTEKDVKALYDAGVEEKKKYKSMKATHKKPKE